MPEKKFQRRVMTQLLEIKEELRRNVEPDGMFSLSTLTTLEEFEDQENQLKRAETRATMVSQLCKIGKRFQGRHKEDAGQSFNQWPDG
ncbi:hypothetical protein GJAV_G00059110 [Gymnothorax javanicus]|nr:hypothetical protein GJAV_G00059110 [Gymnothorax javanicus]